MTTTPKIVDFPLPQELKDEIWSYLLDGQKLQRTPPGGRQSDPHRCELTHKWRPAYKFHTNILAVSKTIGGNASKFLIKRNTFVTIRYDCGALSTCLEHLQIPLVAWKNLPNFQNHAFELNIDWRADLLEVDNGTFYSSSPCGLLVLEKDMPDLWLILQFFCLKVIPPRLALEEGFLLNEGDDEQAGVPVAHVSVRKVEVTRETLHHFLNALEHVVGLGYDMRVEGFDMDVDDSRLVRLRHAVAPQVVAPSIRGLHIVNTLAEVKRKVDGIAVAGHIESAGVMYDYLGVYSLKAWNFCMNVCRHPMAHLRIIITISLIWWRLRGSDFTSARNACQQVSRLILHHSATQLMRDALCHMQVLVAILGRQNGVDDPRLDLPGHLNQLQTITTRTEHLLHGIALLESALVQATLEPGPTSRSGRWKIARRMLHCAQEDVLCVDNFSVGCLPFPVFQTHEETTCL